MNRTQQLAIAAKNGVSAKLFSRRLELGWTVERAIHTPVNNHRVISNEQYEIAKQNGVSKRVLRHRVFAHGWDLEKAITTPLQPNFGKERTFDPALIDLAAKNGISYQTYRGRVRKHGWDPHKAAVTPVKRSVIS